MDNDSPQQQPGGFYQHGGFSQPYENAQPGGFSQPYENAQPGGFSQPYGSPQPAGSPQPGGFDEQGDVPSAPVFCPQCGSDAAVKTVRELFDLMAGGPAALFQSYSQAMQQQGQNRNNPNYDPYHPERDIAGGSTGYRRTDYRDNAFGADSIAEDIGGAVLGAAMGFVGRSLAKKMQKALQDKVIPAMQQAQAQQAQARQKWLPSQAEQDAIVERYPELRGCLRDQVAFLAGGSRTVPIREIQMPITLTSADNLVAKLR